MALKPSSAIQKGKDLENYVAAQLREKGLDVKATRAHGSGNGNVEKADIWTSLTILGQNAGIECKHYTALDIPGWWRQTKKLEKLGREPVLVFKQTFDQYADTRVVVYLETLLELVKRVNASEFAGFDTLPAAAAKTREDHDTRVALEQLRSAINRVLKHIGD